MCEDGNWPDKVPEITKSIALLRIHVSYSTLKMFLLWYNSDPILENMFISNDCFPSISYLGSNGRKFYDLPNTMKNLLIFAKKGMLAKFEITI